MIDILKTDDNNLPQTIRLLKSELLKRGWEAETPYLKSPHIFIRKKTGDTPIHIFSSVPATTSFAAGLLANDKYGIYQLLDKYDISQPATIMTRCFETECSEESKEFLKKFNKVVVKPIDGGHGNGITVGVDNEQVLFGAIIRAQRNNKGSSRNVLLQEMVDADSSDIRILCIDYKFVAAIHRVPASIVGDGEHTVAELIHLENTTFRGKAYYAELATIDIERAMQYLGSKMNAVPRCGEEIQVIGVANYGSGGKLIDVTDDIPAWLISDAETVAKHCGLPVCGVDYLIGTLGKDIEKSTASAYVIEVNKAPSLAIHDKPTVGKNRQAVKKYVDYLDGIGGL